MPLSVPKSIVALRHLDQHTHTPGPNYCMLLISLCCVFSLIHYLASHSITGFSFLRLAVIPKSTLDLGHSHPLKFRRGHVLCLQKVIQPLVHVWRTLYVAQEPRWRKRRYSTVTRILSLDIAGNKINRCQYWGDKETESICRWAEARVICRLSHAASLTRIER